MQQTHKKTGISRHCCRKVSAAEGKERNHGYCNECSIHYKQKKIDIGYHISAFGILGRYPVALHVTLLATLYHTIELVHSPPCEHTDYCAGYDITRIMYTKINTCKGIH